MGLKSTSRHLKSGSAENGARSGSVKANGIPKSKNSDAELTAVRQRIGTLLSSNHILEDTVMNDFKKKDLGMKTQTNPFMLATDSGIAPPSNNYDRSRPSEDGMALSNPGGKTTYGSSQME